MVFLYEGLYENIQIPYEFSNISYKLCSLNVNQDSILGYFLTHL